MEKYTIINMKRNGVSSRSIARQTGMNRKTVDKYWNDYIENQRLLEQEDDPELIKKLQEEVSSEPKYDISNRVPRKYTDDLDAFVDSVLDEEDEKNRLLGTHKQHLTCVQIHELATSAGYDIGRSTLSNYIRIKKNKRREAYIRQEYELGDRLEYDFGEVKLVIGGIAGTYHMAVLASPAANFRWAYLYTNQKKDVFLDSHVRYFEMIGGVYREVVYDNMKNVVTRFIGRNEKELNDDLIKLSLYYGFEINVTNCFSGNEKGYVESSVKKLRNAIFSKKYKFDDLESAQAYMLDRLQEINKAESCIDDEKKCLLPYKPPYELGKLTKQKVSKYSLIQVEDNFYSVPDHLVDEWVKVKTYQSEIMVYSKSRMVARHKKIDGSQQMQIDIYHYLDTLKKKPGALKNSKALKSRAELKTIYDTYFTKKTREFIEIMTKNTEKNYDELLDILKKAVDIDVHSTEPKKISDNSIAINTQNQVEVLSDMFRKGGAGYVN